MHLDSDARSSLRGLSERIRGGKTNVEAPAAVPAAKPRPVPVMLAEEEMDPWRKGRKKVKVAHRPDAQGNKERHFIKWEV